MTLRNAFGEMALDATVQSLVDTLEGLQQYLLDRDRASSRVLQYARDGQDRMHVNVSTGNSTVTTNFGNTAGAAPAWYASGGPSAMDAREIERDMSTQTFQQRRARWEFT